MPTIQQLPPSVVNKIAAGEVIERPASLIKELMENAIDAGALRVDVAVEQGGSELIRVTDSGCGIEAEQLPLAVSSHATSKLREAEDLYRVTTLGFRGEALASIGQVSRMLLRSRPHGGDMGSELEVVGGELGSIVPCGCPPGTSIEVRNLFFNTPVRRKFLRSVQSEMSHCAEAFTRIALAYPHVHFTLSHNDRMLHELAPMTNWRERIGSLFGDELCDSLIEVERTESEVTLNGYVANPAQSRANNRLQYLFVNGRAIRDRSLQHALAEAYRGLLMTGRQPICFLRLEMPPDSVDVNVHPTKAEVRFQDSGRLYSQLLAALRTKFLSTDLTVRYEPSDRAWSSGAQAEVEPPRAPAPWQPAAGAWRSIEQQAPSGLDLPGEHPAGLAVERTSDHAIGPGRPGTRDAMTIGPCGVAALQVHNRYLVAESEEGVVVFDQHALHERILYEQLRERVLGGTPESQTLLVPEPVDLRPAEAAAVLERRDLLARLGVDVQPFGGDTVLVRGYPAMLANMSPAEVLRDLVEHLLSANKAPESRNLLDELLQRIACKAAIKAGDRLAPEEITALLELRHQARDSHHCPHGRPTALVFTREELDRQFKRI